MAKKAKPKIKAKNKSKSAKNKKTRTVKQQKKIQGIDEFFIIENFFKKGAVSRKDALLSIGDDAAVIKSPPNENMVVTTDTLIEGVHFPKNTRPHDVGYKSVAVNLSDMAAMGAKPAWATLALTMPAYNEKWLTDFCRGFFKLLDKYNIQLVGGDLTKGPLSITVQMMGHTQKNRIFKRGNAASGDLIYVTGTLGDAGVGLKIAQKKMKLKKLQDEKYFLNRLNLPMPRLEQANRVLDLATTAIDISDGLLQDLDHIVQASGLGMLIWTDKIPLSEQMRKNFPFETALNMALTAGDDYELCFLVPPPRIEKIEAEIKKWDVPCVCIGTVEWKPAVVEVQTPDGYIYELEEKGYKHF